MNEEQIMEWEVLQSIFCIDECFKRISDSRLMYTLGAGTEKTFVFEIDWPANYPAIHANINMDVFYNSHISPGVRNGIRDLLLEVSKENEGMASSFTIIEYAKENFEKLTSNWELAITESIGEVRLEDEKTSKEVPKTKSAKRRMWDRNEGTGFERGYNWVDIIKHLSQTRDS